MTARNGKVARLPRQVRNELNQRLDNGEPGETLLEWLNELPTTKGVLESNFGGRPISPQNLSEWRNGGFKDWLRDREKRDFVRGLADCAEDLEEAAVEADISEYLASMVAAEFAKCSVTLIEEASSPQERWKVLRQTLEELRHLRRWDQNQRRLSIDEEAWEIKSTELYEQQKKRDTAQIKRRIMAPIFAAMQREELAKKLGGTEAAGELAWFISAVEHDLPDDQLRPRKNWKPPQPDPVPTEPYGGLFNPTGSE